MIIPPNTLLQNRYLVKRTLSQSNTGAVYQATDQSDGHPVVLKQIISRDARQRKAIHAHAVALTRLKHASLPAVQHYFPDKTGQFLVMQYIPGDHFLTLIEKQRQKFLSATVLPWILRWADHLLDALGYLHKQQPAILHGDIKPQNLKPTSRGDILLLDSGIGKTTAAHPYAPLEYVRGAPLDESSDVYALAATLYHLMSGGPPPDAQTRAVAVADGQPDPLRPVNELNTLVPIGVAMILHQAMEQDPQYRFATATAMRTALRMAKQPLVKPVDEGGSSGMQTIVEPAAQPEAPPPDTPSPIAHEPEQTDALDDTSDLADDTGHLDAEPAGPPPPIPFFIVAQYDPQAHFQTVAEAIDHAPPGAYIFLKPGIYKESLTLTKPVSLIGDGPLANIIIESTDHPCATMQTDYALVRGITLRRHHATTPPPAQSCAVDIPQGRLLLEGCSISSNTDSAIAIHTAEANPVIWRCEIQNDTGCGIAVWEQGHGMIEACDITGAATDGIRIRQDGNPIVRQCTLYDCQRSGISIAEKSSGVIEACDIFDNAHAGIEIAHHSNPLVRACSIHEQLEGYGILVTDKGAGFIEGCDIYGNAQTGITITQESNPFICRCTIHDEKGVGIAVSENGRGTIDSCIIGPTSDTGVRITDEGNPTFRNCNIGKARRSGILVSTNGTGSFQNCTIHHNAHAGVEVGQFGNPDIRSCTINHNKMAAVQIHEHGGAIVEECDLTNNTRGPWAIEEGCMVLGSGNRE